jgi:hypothetical protein
MDQHHRLATREEFKAEFDRILGLGPDQEQDKRSLGVLVNPLFGFTPVDRPVFWRVLAVQQRLHSAFADRSARAIFEETLSEEAEHLIQQAVS